MNISQVCTGFIEIPGKISLNIYAQGCKKRCKGCHNLHLWPFGIGTDIYFWNVVKLIEDYSMCNWICWLGGNATDQPEELKKFNREFKKYDKFVCLYTGSFFEDIQDLVQDVDLVIDGEYQQEHGSILNQSTNQRIWLKSRGDWCKIRNWKELDNQLSSESFSNVVSLNQLLI